MTSEPQLSFPPFHLDLTNEQLWRGAELLPLRPKAFRLLRYLAEHPQRLVTQEELLRAIWQHSYLSDGLLRGYIRELRALLGDDAKAPRFIETASGRGYRFLASITPISPVPGPMESSVPPTLQPPPDFVGRQEELAQVHRALERALLGERQLVFVAGEPGIGKTTLVDAFLAQVVGARGLWVGRGQCIDHYGAGEAYLPLLEAFGGLARREGPALIPLLRRQAPTWLVQMPALMEDAEREVLSCQLYGSTQERMGRELAGALEALTAERPLVLWLEDLQWSDLSTVDLLAMLARRREPARLLVVGTYRPAEVMASGHPLRALVRELEAHAQCRGLPLGFLTSPEVTQYLAARFAPPEPQAARLEEWGRFIHGRTDGNPLFMVAMVDDLMGRGVIGEAAAERPWPAPSADVAGELPESLRQLIDHQLDRLSPAERGVIEAASVAGMEFSAPWVAAALETEAGLGEDAAVVEAQCEELARRHQFIRDRGFHQLPNGEVAARYGFIHALYQDVLYERVPAAKRVHLHRRVGEREEELYGERAGEIAAELAMHFERGRDYRRAVKYLVQTTETAIRRFAHQEAIVLARQGLELLQTLPDTSERVHQELRLHIALGVPLTVTQGFAAPDVGRAYAKALELCERLGETAEIFQVLWGLRGFHMVRAELETARELAERILRLAQDVQDPALRVRGHLAMEIALTNIGEFPLALKHFEALLSLYDPEQHGADACRYVLNPASAPRCFAAWTLCLLGLADQASSRIQEALILAREWSDPHGLTHVLFYAAVLHQLRREERLAQECAEAAIALSSEHGLVHYLPQATIIRGWALAEQGRHEEGIEQMRQGLAAYEATGAKLVVPHLLGLLAEALGKAGRPEEGLSVLYEARVVSRQSGNHYYDAELYRLEGELLLMQAVDRHISPAATDEEVVVEDRPTMVMEVERRFNEAISIARKQRAKFWELRAVMSLGRLRMRQGRQAEARSELAELYGWFTEGFDTKDLREARALLEIVA